MICVPMTTRIKGYPFEVAIAGWKEGAGRSGKKPRLARAQGIDQGARGRCGDCRDTGQVGGAYGRRVIYGDESLRRAGAYTHPKPFPANRRGA